MDMPRPGVTVRWILAACISGGGLIGLARVLGGSDSNMMSVFAKCLFGLAAMMAGVIMVSPEAVLWVLSPIHRALDHIFLPSESVPPPVDYRLARFYGQRMRYAEASVEYAKIILYHPKEKNAYLEGIQAAGRAGDEEAARRFLRGARRLMRSPDERALLENVYAVRHVPPHGALGEGTEGDAAEPAAKFLER